jgi:hypothetical protein
MAATEIASYMSLALAFIFWYLSSRQADNAKKTLDDIKTEILTWQAQLNKAAIDIISSRPEVIAKQTALEETKSLCAFDTQIAELIKHISSNPLPKEEGGEYQLQVLDKLLAHHQNIILGKQQLMAQVVAYQGGQHPIKSETKQNKGNE